MFLAVFQQNPAAAVALLLGLLGDDTAYRAGRMTLNPASHLDLLGSLMFLMAGFGWGKPTPVVTSKLRGGVLGPVAVAAAGPLSNLLIVAACAALYLLPAFQSGYLQTIVLLVAFGNALLFVFNLIPIPPLDGAKVIFPFLPRSLSGFVDFMNQYGPMILLGLVLLTFLPVLPSPLSYILALVGPVLAAFGLPPIF
jgi:Zn-dependent protease